MSSNKKFYEKIIFGKSDNNINFNDICNFLKHLGFIEKINGSHHIFRMEGIEMKLTLQKDDSEAKAYQVKQVRQLLIDNNLGEFDV